MSLDQRIVAGLPGGVLLVSPEGRVLMSNPECRTILGKDLTGRDLMQDDPEDDSNVFRILEWYRQHRVSAGATGELVVADAEPPRYYWLSLSSGGGDRVIQMQDIGPALREPAQLAKVVSRLTHDLRGPLTSIAGAAELLSSGRIGDLEESGRRMSRIIEESADKMRRILDQAKDDFVRDGAAESAGGADE